MVQRAYAPPAHQKKGCGRVAVLVGIVAVLGVAALAGAGYYFFGTSGTKVTSVAHRHLPKGCDVALRLDITALTKVGPVKEHVVAAIEDVMTEEGGGRLAAFLLAARMDPKKDIREIAVCLDGVKMGSDPDYAIIIGGRLLDENGVIEALDKHDSANELSDPRKVGKLLVMEDKEGVLVSQSPDDAAILVAGDDDDLKRIANKGTDFEDYDIPMDEQIVGVISPKTIAGFVGGFGPLGPNTDALKKVGRVVLTMTLDPGEFGMRMTFPDKTIATEAKGQLESLFGVMALAPMDASIKSAVAKAKLKTKGKDLLVTMPIDESAIEETCEEMADEIRDQNK